MNSMYGYKNVQSTTDDIIHIYSDPTKLILLACLTTNDANDLIIKKTLINSDYKEKIHIRSSMNNNNTCFRIHCS